MRIRTVLGVAVTTAIAVAAGAAPAHATTDPQGTTTLIECNDVVNAAQVKDSTGAGLNYTTKDMKASGVTHPEGFAAGSVPKLETDTGATPDYGETDSCTGPLTTTSNPWKQAGSYTPNSPSQNITAPFNDITAIAGALTGRTDCNTAITTPSAWGLHGKLTIKFGNEASATATATPTSLDALGKAVQSQVYVNSRQIAGYQDLIEFYGVAIKGTGEGAFFDSRGSFRPPAADLTYAAEACSFNADLNADGVIGTPPAGGLIRVVLDTDVDTDVLGAALTGGDVAAYNNSMVWSI